mgnify:CR=1 FL=1
MEIIQEHDIRSETLCDIAKKMLLAARTAPKGKGQDHMVLSMMQGDEIKRVSERLTELGQKYDHKGFLRDAKNILAAPVVLLFGTKIQSIGLTVCGMCGFTNCSEKDAHPSVPCVFNTGDLGIAIGSAVSVAMDYRVDNRIMYTVGQAVLDLKLLGDDVKIVYAIPLGADSKNPFFDRG